MPTEIQIPSVLITALQVVLAFGGAFLIALWVSLIIWTFRDARLRSRDVFSILLATLMVTIFGPLGVILYFLLRPPVTLAELYERSLEEEALLQDLEERPYCPSCSRQVNEAWVLCPDCHTTLKTICPQCQNSLHLNWNVCPYCGTVVAESGVAPDDHDHSGLVETAEQAKTATRPMRQVEMQPASAGEETKQEIESAFRGDETRPQLPEAGPA